MDVGDAKSNNDKNNDDASDNDSNTDNTNPIMQLELTDEVKQQEIVTSYVFNPETDNLSIALNHKYSEKKITSPIESTWPKTITILTKELHRKKISPEHITMLCDVADNSADKILKLRRNRQAEKEKEEENNQRLGSQSRRLLNLAIEQSQELFVNQYGEPYAAVRINEHIETLNLNHTRFKNWICKSYYEQEGLVPSSESITNVLNILNARAEFDGNVKELHLRVAYDTNETESGTTRTDRTIIFYDLTNKKWEVIKITSEGRTIEKAPIIFRRYNAQPQVYPSENYPPDIFDRFMKLLNVKDEKIKLLIKCYIITLFIPEIDKPILMLHGDPRGAKTTLEELINTLVNPSSVLTFALPKDNSELVQQLDHNYVVYYDNLSKIPDWISDQFCRASTGGGSSKRRLYTDDDDKIYNFKRCVGFSGVNLAATKSDLLDRGLIIKVERIDDKVMRKKEHILRELEEIRPQLLGYIFDTLIKFLAMRQSTSIKFEKLPRMADFAECAEIISRCMGNPVNLFLDAYYENIGLQTEEVLETSLVASAILKFMEGRNEWNGNQTDLLERLDEVVGDKVSKNKYWPKTPSVLSRRINEVKTNLREVGIFIKEGPQDPVTRVKTIVITKPADIGKMPFEQFEPFDRRGDGPNNDAHDKTGMSMIPGMSMTPAKNSTYIIQTKIMNVNTKIEINPFYSGFNVFKVKFTDESGKPYTKVSTTEMVFSNTAADISNVVANLQKIGPGVFSVTGAYISQPGEWDIALSAQRVQDLDLNYGFTAKVTNAPSATQNTGAVNQTANTNTSMQEPPPRFDSFAWLTIVLAAAVIFGSAFYYRRSKQELRKTVEMLKVE